MEMLIIIALIISAVWFFTFGSYKTSIKDPASLTEPELENAFIELKKKILITNVYEHEQTYERLYWRIRAVLGQIMERHRHFVLDIEAKGADVRRLFIRREYRDADGGRHEEYVVPNDLDLKRKESDELLYLCFFLYLGGRAKNVGSVEGDPKLMVKILDYLINEKQYHPASFLKGFVMKYGIEFYKECYPGEARILLEFAQRNGVGSAAIELHQFAGSSLKCNA
ncbi:MAG: hypothetical protein HKM00_06210 [Gallionella sp.]|jgi:hypothetical protein|nr:hypothetical protein [Gallionella sp.]